jgi:SAM-dependent methyltransferase
MEQKRNRCWFNRKKFVVSEYPNISAAGGDTAKPRSLQKRIRLIAGSVQGRGLRILDCGCGAGTYVKYLRGELGMDAFGIEYLAEKVAIAKSDPELSPFIWQGDLQRIPFESCSFDAALLNEVLEHVPDEIATLEEIRRILKPAGILFVFCPNRLFPFETHGVHLKWGNWKIAPYVPLIPYIPLVLGQIIFDYWARNYWPWELRALVARSGFKIAKVDFVWQTFENISGQQPWFIRLAKPALQNLSDFCEKTPLVRHLGVSQALILSKAG